MADLSNYIGTYYPNGPMIEPGGALAFDVLATSWEAAEDLVRRNEDRWPNGKIVGKLVATYRNDGNSKYDRRAIYEDMLSDACYAQDMADGNM